MGNNCIKCNRHIGWTSERIKQARKKVMIIMNMGGEQDWFVVKDYCIPCMNEHIKAKLAMSLDGLNREDLNLAQRRIYDVGRRMVK